MLRVGLQYTAQQFQRGVVLLHLQGENAQVVPGVGVVGLFGQNGAVTLLGLGQFSRLVMGDGGLELGGKIGGGGLGHDGNQSRWPAVRDDAGAR